MNSVPSTAPAPSSSFSPFFLCTLLGDYGKWWCNSQQFLHSYSHLQSIKERIVVSILCQQLQLYIILLPTGEWKINGFTAYVTFNLKVKPFASSCQNCLYCAHFCRPSLNHVSTANRSGRYFHNIKMVNSTLWAMHVNEPLVNNNTFAKHLKEDAGYTVGMFGKYQNIMPKTVPPGIARNVSYFFSLLLCLFLYTFFFLLFPPSFICADVPHVL